MPTTYIKLDRSLQSWEWYTDGNTLRVFLDLLLNANFEERKWQGKAVGRGQLIASYSLIAERTGMTVAQVRRAVEHLVKSGTITTRLERRCNLITIVNYDIYQSDYEMTEKKPSPPPYVYPTADEINAYAASLGKAIDAFKFIDYYNKKNWMFRDGSPLNWKAAVKSWKTEFVPEPQAVPEEELDDWGRPIKEVGESSGLFTQ